MNDPTPIPSPDDGRYRLDLESLFPLTALLRPGSLRLADLAKKCGYSNIDKGVRRLEALADGDLRNFESLKLPLAEALGIDIDQLIAAATDTKYIQWARQDRAYRRDFQPHVIWKTALTKSGSSSSVGRMGLWGKAIASRKLSYIPSTADAMEISAEAVANCPQEVPSYGTVTGFYINFSPDYAVEFDREGEALAVLDTSLASGRSTESINRRPITLADKFRE